MQDFILLLCLFIIAACAFSLGYMFAGIVRECKESKQKAGDVCKLDIYS